MKKYTINIPIYPGRLIIILTKDFNKITKKYEIKDMNGYGAFTFSRDHKKGWRRYFVVFKPEKVSLNYIVHESKHIVNAMYINKNMDLDRYNDEHECYILAWVFREIYKKLKRNKAIQK